MADPEIERLKKAFEIVDARCFEYSHTLRRYRKALETISQGAPFGFTAQAYEEIARKALAPEQ